MDKNFFDELSNKISQVLPEGIQDIKKDTEKNIKAMLLSAFDKLDLVTREEFDVQTKVLAKTRKKLDELEKKLAAFTEQQPPVKK